MKSILTEVQNGCIEAGTMQADFGKHATGTLRTRLHLKGWQGNVRMQGKGKIREH